MSIQSGNDRGHSLDDLNFDNRFVGELPADPETVNQRRQVYGACYSRVDPIAVRKPKLVAYAREVADLLNLDRQACESEQFLEVFSGNRLLPDMDPYATCYGGHQFGNWAGQLGDGRAINLGEVVNSVGQRWALQLKGAGPTPYSRMADGFAVLRSSVREFLCSEAMHHLGVPTTRALSLIETGRQVVRDMFYDGNPEPEPGAVVCRVAPSFTRFGSFQIFTSRNEIEQLKQLLDYTIRTDFPHLVKETEITLDIYSLWFEEVCRTTAEMIIHWMRVGFVHGVMNTDNMSILGLTIDYGPYGWLEDFDPGWTPNTTDAGGRRYRYGSQPKIAMWNLEQLAKAVYPVFNEVAPLQQGLNIYAETYNSGWQQMMAGKLGLKEFDSNTDDALVTELQAILQMVETDMTIFYRNLAQFDRHQAVDQVADSELISPLLDAYYQPDQITEQYSERLGNWLRSYKARLDRDNLPDRERLENMNTVNPKYVLRNYLAQLAIDKAEQGDYSMVVELLDVLRNPYTEQAGKESYAEKRPDWARHRAGCSMLSCSS